MDKKKEYSYKSIQRHSDCVGGKCTRTVIIKGGSGYKQLNRTRKRLTRKEVAHIKRGKFIPGLFDDLL